jgi:hypothetical protein
MLVLLLMVFVGETHLRSGNLKGKMLVW